MKEIDFLFSFFDGEVNEREKENRLEEEQVEFYQFLTSLTSRTLLFQILFPVKQRVLDGWFFLPPLSLLQEGNFH